VSPAPELKMRDGATTLAQLIDAYMHVYEGRDDTRAPRLAYWRGTLGHLTLAEISDDDVHAAREQLADKTARFFAGFDADGKPIFKARRGKLSGPTINRYVVALSAVITWATRRRLTPRGFVHPVRNLKAYPENPGRVRFLSDDERERLLAACRASRWERLYMFVLMAITTGARRGELLHMRWGDVDLARKVVHVARTKNGDAKVMPLVPAVVEEMQRFAGGASELLFPARLRPDHPMAIEDRWRQALREAGIKNARLHDLRHTTASYLARSGATLLEIADVLGHRTVRMAARYSHLAAGHRAALIDRVMGGMK
jgi:integrase